MGILEVMTQHTKEYGKFPLRVRKAQSTIRREKIRKASM